MKREYLRKVWLTFKILVRTFELSFTIHPHYCASQFLRIIFLSGNLAPRTYPLAFELGYDGVTNSSEIIRESLYHYVNVTL